MQFFTININKLLCNTSWKQDGGLAATTIKTNVHYVHKDTRDCVGDAKQHEQDLMKNQIFACLGRIAL